MSLQHKPSHILHGRPATQKAPVKHSTEEHGTGEKRQEGQQEDNVNGTKGQMSGPTRLSTDNNGSAGLQCGCSDKTHQTVQSIKARPNQFSVIGGQKWTPSFRWLSTKKLYSADCFLDSVSGACRGISFTDG